MKNAVRWISVFTLALGLLSGCNTIDLAKDLTDQQRAEADSALREIFNKILTVQVRSPFDEDSRVPLFYQPLFDGWFNSAPATYLQEARLSYSGQLRFDVVMSGYIDDLVKTPVRAEELAQLLYVDLSDESTCEIQDLYFSITNKPDDPTENEPDRNRLQIFANGDVKLIRWARRYYSEVTSQSGRLSELDVGDSFPRLQAKVRQLRLCAQ